MTDIDYQYKYMIHRRKHAIQILKHAKKIIFISSRYKEKLFSLLPVHIANYINKNSLILPNGIDDFYLSHYSDKTRYTHNDSFRLLYLGQIQKRKNLLQVINAVEEMNSTYNITLNIIGGFNLKEIPYYKKILKRIKNLNYIQYFGEILNKDEILVHLKNSHVLIVPSKNELFGIVYIEAISQNTPVIYLAGEGIEPFLKRYDFAVGAGRSENNFSLYLD
ncbi:Glycogen synthase, partial [termite gut metagenome]